MVSASRSLGIRISKSKLAEIRRGAGMLGVTPAEYVLTLVKDGLARERRIRETPIEELAAPLTKALQAIIEAELDALVDEARHAGARKRKSR